jgi:hypothetical protein
MFANLHAAFVGKQMMFVYRLVTFVGKHAALACQQSAFVN